MAGDEAERERRDRNERKGGGRKRVMGPWGVYKTQEANWAGGGLETGRAQENSAEQLTQPIARAPGQTSPGAPSAQLRCHLFDAAPVPSDASTSAPRCVRPDALDAVSSS